MRRDRFDMRANVVRVAAAGLTAFSISATAGWSDDPLDTARDLPPTTDQRIAQAGILPCSDVELRQPLTLLDAASRALCFNPQTRQAWSAVEAQAAAVGLGRSAYLPSASASATVSRVNESAKYPGMADYDASLHGGSNEETIALNWVLFDFGLRSASLRRERALLDAAAASRDESIRAVFSDATRAYFAAVLAQATFAADVEAEQLARRSVEVVTAKAAAGVGSEADRLQANTAGAQASLSRIRANENLQKSLGALAVVMGVRPGTALILQQPDAQPAEVSEVTAMADHLIEHALQTHPRVAAARAQLAAAQDNVAAVQAAGRPSIALSAIGDRSDNPVNRVSTEQTIETSSIGLQLTIPLFEGFGRTYRIRQAKAELEGRQAALFAAQQDVARDVWDSYVTVRSGAEDLRASEILLDNARQSFAQAMGRYQASVGSVIELLKAQSDLASSRDVEAQARIRWRLSRLQLAASLGEVDLSMLRDTAQPPAPATAFPETPAGAAPETAPLTTSAMAPAATPVIASITPKPVPGGKGPQALTIAGQHFIDGAKVHLRDQTHGVNFPDRQPIIVEDSSIWVWAEVGCGSTWTAEVINPDGRSSGPFPFHVVASCAGRAAARNRINGDGKS